MHLRYHNFSGIEEMYEVSERTLVQKKEHQRLEEVRSAVV